MPWKNAKTWADYENDRKDWHERQAALKNIGPKARVWMQQRLSRAKPNRARKKGKPWEPGSAVWATLEDVSHDMEPDEARR